MAMLRHCFKCSADLSVLALAPCKEEELTGHFLQTKDSVAYLKLRNIEAVT